MDKITVSFDVKEMASLRCGIFHAYLYYKRSMETALPDYINFYREEMEQAKALYDRLMTPKEWD